MIRDMRRLYPRGAANRGVCVDAEGAALGADYALVSRISGAYRPIGRSDAAALQKCFFDDDRDADWLFRQCQCIADALNEGELALAQIQGLHVTVGALDARTLRRNGLVKDNLNPDEPRLPKGDRHGGEWTAGSVEDQDQQVADVPLNGNKDDCIRYCFEETSVPKAWGGDPFWACLPACQGKFPSPLFPEFDGHFS